EGAVAAAVIHPAQPRGRRQPCEEVSPREAAPTRHPALVRGAVVEPYLLAHVIDLSIRRWRARSPGSRPRPGWRRRPAPRRRPPADRKSTRLNSSHDQISYAVFCLKKKTPGPDASPAPSTAPPPPPAPAAAAA